MRLYDITKDLFEAPVYPGDPVPETERILELKKGDACNLTYLKLCAHNGTHMDAPRHFFDEGDSIEMLPLEQVMGKCSVLAFDGVLDGKQAWEMTEGKERKILWKGDTVLTEEAAESFVRRNIELVGVERQTVGSDDKIEAVHKILLGAGMAILEGLELESVQEGTYFICAQPLKLKGLDGAPCRAVLIEDIFDVTDAPSYRR